MKWMNFVVMLALALTLAACASKSNNPLDSDSQPPRIITDGAGFGFADSVQVFIAEKKYPFAFRVESDDERGANTSLVVSDNTGSYTLTDSSGEKSNRTYRGYFTTDREGKHKIFVSAWDRVEGKDKPTVAELNLRLGRQLVRFKLSKSDAYNDEEITIDPTGSISANTQFTIRAFFKRHDGLLEPIGETTFANGRVQPIRWTVGGPISQPPVKQHRIGGVIIDGRVISDTLWQIFTIKDYPSEPSFVLNPLDDPIYEVAKVDTAWFFDRDDRWDNRPKTIEWYARQLQPTVEPTRRHLPYDNDLNPGFLSGLSGGDYEITLRVGDDYGVFGEQTKVAGVWGLPEPSFIFKESGSATLAIINDTTATIDARSSSGGWRSRGIANYTWQEERLSTGETRSLANGPGYDLLPDFRIYHHVDAYEITLQLKNKEGKEGLVKGLLEILNTVAVPRISVEVECQTGQCRYTVHNDTSDRDPFDVLRYQWGTDREVFECFLTSFTSPEPVFIAIEPATMRAIIMKMDQPGGSIRLVVWGDQSSTCLPE